jgi:hypothetical protein
MCPCRPQRCSWLLSPPSSSVASDRYVAAPVRSSGIQGQTAGLRMAFIDAYTHFGAARLFLWSSFGGNIALQDRCRAETPRESDSGGCLVCSVSPPRRGAAGTAGAPTRRCGRRRTWSRRRRRAPPPRIPSHPRFVFPPSPRALAPRSPDASVASGLRTPTGQD